MATAIRPPTRSKRKPSSTNTRQRVAVNELRDLRRCYGMPQALLSRLLDVSLRTLSGAESAGAVPPRMRRSVTQVVRLCNALGEAMQPGFVGQWFDRPSELLGNLKPVEALERGQTDLVWQVVEGLRSGSQL